ncbi:MAG: energy transducer TonB [Steroidobacteraceae bacterium]
MHRSSAMIALVLAAAMPVAQADFRTALGEYHAGQYGPARHEFLRLAKVGDAASQHNLGTMALHGQGSPVDLGEAYGWFRAARENGQDDVSDAQLAGLRSELKPADEARAAQIVAAYGRAAMSSGVLPPSPESAQCARYVPPAVLVEAPAPFAHAAREAGRSGVGIVAFTVGTDGVARDPVLVATMPAPPFGQPAVDSVLNSRYTSARFDDRPVAARTWSHVGFKLSAGVASIWSREILAGLKAAAVGGDLPSLYLYGVIARLDPTLGESRENAEAIILEAAQAGNADAQFWLAMSLAETRRCGEDRSLPWLRAAAEGGHVIAGVALGEHLLEGEPDVARVAEARRLFSNVVGSDNAWALKHAIAHLASSPREALRDAPTALRASARLFVKDRNLSQDPQTFDALAAARAANGDFRGAAKAQQQAIAAAGSLQWNPSRMHERLAAYRAGTMWYGHLLAVREGIVTQSGPLAC